MYKHNSTPSVNRKCSVSVGAVNWKCRLSTESSSIYQRTCCRMTDRHPRKYRRGMEEEVAGMGLLLLTPSGTA